MSTLASTQKPDYRNLPRCRFSKEAKRRIVEQMLSGAMSLSQFARDKDIHTNQLTKWRREYLAGRFGPPQLSAPVEVSPQWMDVAVSDADTAGAVTLSRTGVAEGVPRSRSEEPELPVRLRVSLRKGDVLLVVALHVAHAAYGH